MEAQYNAYKAMQQKMHWGYSPEEARKAASMAPKRQQPQRGGKNYVWEDVHAEDLRLFKHKVATTFQYATAGLMYGALLKTIYTLTGAV